MREETKISICWWLLIALAVFGCRLQPKIKIPGKEIAEKEAYDYLEFLDIAATKVKCVYFSQNWNETTDLYGCSVILPSGDIVLLTCGVTTNVRKEDTGCILFSKSALKIQELLLEQKFSQKNILEK